MKTNVYAIYDLKARAFMQPFFSLVDATAQRAVQGAMSDPSSMLGRHPEDFVLFRVASFEDENGAFSPTTPPHQVCMVAALKVRQEEPGHEDAVAQKPERDAAQLQPGSESGDSAVHVRSIARP